jgi:hypothetical protein
MTDTTPEQVEMRPVRLNRELLRNITGTKIQPQVDPAFKQITEGLQTGIRDLLRDPSKVGISCCIEGCCVSWCCIQIS